MKESRRIFKAEFELLIDKYRLAHGDRDRHEMADYFFTFPGFDKVRRLPDILRRLNDVEKEMPRLTTNMAEVDTTAKTLVEEFTVLKANQAKEWKDVTAQMQVDLDSMNSKVSRLQSDT